jgi:CMP-N,N'-diacetyllegionaminic acid synthase
MTKKVNETWAIIPARSGSKGVPDKNIKMLAGHPIIAYSIHAAMKTPNIARVIVSTDSTEYAEIAQKYGAEIPFIRPAEISGDKSTDIEFFKHLIEWFRHKEDYIPEYLVHLRPTTPLRDPNIINNAIISFIGSDYSALRSAHKMSDTTYKTFEIRDNKFSLLCGGGFNIESTTLPRQSFPTTYNPNGYVDIVRTSKIDAGIFHGDCVRAFITDTSFEIDDEEDFTYLEYMVKTDKRVINLLFEHYRKFD